MQRLEIYTGGKTYVAPNGELDTQENILRKFPAALHIRHVVLTDDAREISYGVMSLNALCSRHGVDLSLSDPEKISALEAVLNAPEPEPEPSAQERIAAALEFQNLMAL